MKLRELFGPKDFLSQVNSQLYQILFYTVNDHLLKFHTLCCRKPSRGLFVFPLINFLELIIIIGIRSSGHKQKHGIEASRAKIQQIYENLELDLDLKLFMVTGAYLYESGLYERIATVVVVIIIVIIKIVVIIMIITISIIIINNNNNDNLY